MKKKMNFFSVKYFFIFILFFLFLLIIKTNANTCLPDISIKLQYGDKSEEVRQLQKYLNENGFPLAQSGAGSKGNETTFFGSLTRSALIRFQQYNKISTNLGIFDSPTRIFLGCNEPSIESDIEPILYEFKDNLSFGMNSEEVRQLQKYLNENGFPLAQSGAGSKGNETTFFGSLTRSALIRFQNSKIDTNTNYLKLKTEVGSFFENTRDIINKEKKLLFILPFYTLEYVAGPGGVVAGILNQRIISGESGSLITAIPDKYYKFIDWSDGLTMNPRIDNNVITNKSIKANFYKYHSSGGSSRESSIINTYNLSYSANANGSISGTSAQTINQGNSGSEVIATPDAGYHFIGWSDGILTAIRTDINVSEDISVSASFAINTYEINASVGSNGLITPIGTTTKNYNLSQSYQIEADDGYQIADVLVDGVSVGVVDLYEFSDIQADHTISVSFELIPVSTVVVTAISPVSGYDTKSININSIVGTGFAPSASVKLTKTGEADITCTNIVFASSTTISNASCNIETVSAGDWNVVVTNSDTGSGQLVGGFAVREYTVRDIGPLGGYIFYVNPNYVSDGWKYLEAATSSRSSAAKWADATTTLMNASGTAVGIGLANTEMVTGSDATNNSAIEYVLNYSVNGIDDWFLPSKDELNLMYTELHQHGLGGFATTSHWSSSEINATTTWRQTFNGGAQSSGSKNTSYAIRAIRRFTTCPTYSISYNGNGNTTGTVPVDNTSYLAGASVMILDQNTLAREGYTFTGWNTASDGSGTDYATSSAVSMPVNGITFYAKWYRPNYTIAILPDTQSYVNWKKAEMTDQLDWLVNNKNNLNLKFVSHVGDIVQNWDGVPSDWEFVQIEMAKLKTAGIPYSLLPGNHDYAYMSRDSTVFNTYFPLSNYSDMTSYGGSYDTNSDNQYHILSVDKDNNGSPDDKILILSLEFGPREAVVNWAKGILTANSSTTAIIITHAYLQPDGDMLEYGDNHAASNGYGLGDDVYDGDELWNSLVYPYDNVRFVFSGHDGESNDGSAIRTSTHEDGSSVYQVLSNYQYYPVNEAGYLVLLNFTENQAIMKTYSPWTDTYKIDAESQATWDWIPFNFD